MKTYPKGAISSINELIALKDKTVFEASKEFSKMPRPQILTGLIICKYLKDSDTYYYAYEYKQPDGWKTSSSILDMNVIENPYNDWYLFYSAADAVAYLNGN